MTELPKYRVIRRITYNDEMPEISNGKIGIFVGTHTKWKYDLTKAVDLFCEKNNAVVFCDHTSNYHGKYGVHYNLLSAHEKYSYEATSVDLLIDMGEMSGAYMGLRPKNVWRVNPDGVVRDTFKKLTYMFDMDELDFLNKLNSESFR